MNFPELVDAVAIKTGRPDQQDAIRLALREATLWAHLFDLWRRDVVEIPINYDPAVFTGQLLLDTYLPGLRKVCYWRKYDPLTQAVGEYLKQVDPDNLYDQFKTKKTNVYYLAGRVVNWFSSSSDAGHIIAYWKLPNIDVDNYTSWIATSNPFLLINHAAATIFASIGQQDEARSKMALAQAQMQELGVNEIESAGR